MTSEKLSDLHVEPISNSLSGLTVDLVVSGSIAACEATKNIRALRRLGAETSVFLTRGGAKFTTATSLEWASAKKVTLEFDGRASHIASGDICCIAPASASILEKVVSGSTDTPEGALIQSYLGSKRPILVLPCMHASLWASPQVQMNAERLKQRGLLFIEPLVEEGKLKTPPPDILADQVSHAYHLSRNPTLIKGTVCMGSTKGYFDDIRYISNYSSGALGSMLVEELYRFGIQVSVICGSCQVKPRVWSELKMTETNDSMLNAVNDTPLQDFTIMLAAVLDYVPARRHAGKLRSGEGRQNIELTPTPKIISKLSQLGKKANIGFKLEPVLDSNTIDQAKSYLEKYSLSHMVANSFESIKKGGYEARILSADSNVPIESKPDLVRKLVEIIIRSTKEV